jgi:hypothetical protein
MNQSILEPSYTGSGLFGGSFQSIQSFFDSVTNPNMWHTIGTISGILSIIFIAIIIFVLVRIREMQLDDYAKLDEDIRQALQRDQEIERNANPRWHYITTMVESINESDWRVAIIEADTMMEEELKNRGLSGETTSELLESAKASGYSGIQNAWDAHLVRNQIAHEGANFPLSQIQARRTIRMYQSFFENIGAIS